MKQGTQSQYSGTNQRDKVGKEVGGGVWDEGDACILVAIFVLMHGKNHQDVIKLLSSN